MRIRTPSRTPSCIDAILLYARSGRSTRAVAGVGGAGRCRGSKCSSVSRDTWDFSTDATVRLTCASCSNYEYACRIAITGAGGRGGTGRGREAGVKKNGVFAFF